MDCGEEYLMRGYKDLYPCLKCRFASFYLTEVFLESCANRSSVSRPLFYIYRGHGVKKPCSQPCDRGDSSADVASSLQGDSWSRPPSCWDFPERRSLAVRDVSLPATCAERGSPGHGFPDSAAKCQRTAEGALQSQEHLPRAEQRDPKESCPAAEAFTHCQL